MKRKKQNKRKIIFLLLILLAIIFLIILYMRKEKNMPDNYSNEAKEKLKKENIDIKEYNQTLEAFLKSDDFKKENIEAYMQINFQNEEDFTAKTNALLEKNYSPDEINDIFTYLSKANIQKLLEMDYVNLQDYLKISNLDVSKIDAYKEYEQKNNTTINDAVTKVNLHLDEPFYENVETIEKPDDITVLVNKFHALDASYVPTDLTNVGTYSLQMRKEAAEELEQLIAKAALDNRELIPYSTYRSYDYQKRLYEGYLEIDPKETVDTYSARPGHSEHQTGLACDIRSSILNDRLTDSDYEWMLQNSYEFGFIVRYPKGKSEVTGYMEEPWHIRYIGKEHAKKVHDLDITYDEYYDLYIANH